VFCEFPIARDADGISISPVFRNCRRRIQCLDGKCFEIRELQPFTIDFKMNVFCNFDAIAKRYNCRKNDFRGEVRIACNIRLRFAVVFNADRSTIRRRDPMARHKFPRDARIPPKSNSIALRFNIQFRTARREDLFERELRPMHIEPGANR